ncbi:MAG TPA: cyclic nucleotide-binding domain-containing protein [Gaiellaceae bacterium]|jgi:cyclic nucleotide-binding protein|nr:cyclic nucleotide-binding domain-containing protein [Gaiellaceae bacterium]
MRIVKSVTSVTWIPSEAIEGMPKLPFELGITHYDDPPPDRIQEGDLEALRDADRFREANELRAWIEVDDGKIVDSGYSGGAHVGSTRVKVGPKTLSFAGVKYPLIQHEPERGPDWVKFVQSAGGRMGLPAPRRVRGKPFLQVASASAWTTLQLIIYADGTAKYTLAGASPFPRHWIYDDEGKLVEKSGTVDFERWWRESFGPNMPWGGEDSPAVLAAAESELERELSRVVMTRPEGLERRELNEGEALVEQDQPGTELYLVLDGMLDVEVDGDIVAEVGPGAILGVHASLEGGLRSATLRAATRCRVVVIPEELLDQSELAAIASGQRREMS